MERVRRQDGAEPTPEEALAWATRNGYRALGVPDGGWLGPGSLADLIVIDLRRPHLMPALRVVSCFVHQGQAGDVEAVMVEAAGSCATAACFHWTSPRCSRGRSHRARAWRSLFETRPDLTPPPGFDPTVSPRPAPVDPATFPDAALSGAQRLTGLRDQREAGVRASA